MAEYCHMARKRYTTAKSIRAWRDALGLVAQGHTTRAVADTLSLSHHALRAITLSRAGRAYLAMLRGQARRKAVLDLIYSADLDAPISNPCANIPKPKARKTISPDDHARRSAAALRAWKRRRERVAAREDGGQGGARGGEEDCASPS